MMGQGPIRVALPKGRLLDDSVKLFESMGLSGLEPLKDSRRLVCEDSSAAFRFMILRPADIPTYVEYGATDMGIVGKDLLLEQERDVYEPLDLQFGACRLVVAQPTERGGRPPSLRTASLRVATKYPRLAERYFTERGVQVEIIRLSGSVELAPVLGLSERIVDLVQSGQTLRENGLVELEEIARATARLIVNKAALKTRYRRIRGVIDQIRTLIAHGEHP